jgi:uncharacterized sulfatase
LFLIVLILASTCTLAPAQEKRRPNLIAIVTDDQGYWTVGAYGNRESKTANMDKLAAEGALFTNAFVNTPVCSPSRATFLTGLHGTQVGITDWINMNDANAGVGLPPKTVTWPEVLKQNGYATALVGKWHLGHLPQFHPTRHGYDHFWGILDGGAAAMDPWIEVGGKVQQLKGACSDLTADEAIRWLETNHDKPFALSLHFREPHVPYGPVPDDDSKLYTDVDVTIPDFKGLNAQFTKGRLRAYYGAIHAVDRNIGRLLAKLDEWKIADDTIVLFTSDNGYNVGHHGIHGKGNGNWIAGGVQGPMRPNMFEESVRVPLIVRWPGVVKPGTRIEQPVMNVDMFATVCGMLGLTPPADNRQNGRDFSPLLRGEPVTDWPTTTFGQFDVHIFALDYMRMVRTSDWKLIRHQMFSGSNELYDLKDDPHETRNRYYDKRVADVRDGLQKQLTDWQQSIDDPLLKLDHHPIEPGPAMGQ